MYVINCVTYGQNISFCNKSIITKIFKNEFSHIIEHWANDKTNWSNLTSFTRKKKLVKTKVAKETY
jgi:hypothetical protein